MENTVKPERGTGRERVYNFLVEYIGKNGYAPSIREICTGTGLSSTSTVHSHLEILKLMGRIEARLMHQGQSGCWNRQ